MRIVAGTLRGRTISAPEGEGTRPTVDRVREALFSSLYSLRGGFEGAIVLDAFAGSSALGIEAFSRGAEFAAFVERDLKAAKVLEYNVRTCGLEVNRAAVLRRDVMNGLPKVTPYAFDLVFLDPPYSYDAGEVLGMVSALAEGGMVAKGAIIVYEHALKSAEDVACALQEIGCDVRPSKKYGKTGVTIGVLEGEA